MALSKSALPEIFTSCEEKKMLDKVKKSMEITTDDPDVDNSIRLKMLAVVNLLTNGGASKSSITSPLGIACIALGVNDLMERRAGEVSFSPAFNMLSNQVARG